MESNHLVYTIAPSQLTGQGGIDSYTKLCVHCDGLDESTSFTDSSASGHSITNNGNHIKVETSVKKFGTGSAYATENNDYLSIPANHSDFDFGSNDWTIDFWYKSITCGSGGALFGFFSHYDDEDNASTLYYYRVPGDEHFEYNLKVSGTNEVLLKHETTLDNSWHHYAVIRNGNTFSMFIDGISGDTDTYSGVYPDYDTTFLICNAMLQADFQVACYGYIDEFRVSNNIARWTANFTPPTCAYKRLIK